LDEEEAELEGLEEAASAVSSELDPSKLPMNISCLSVLKADWERSFKRQQQVLQSSTLPLQLLAGTPFQAHKLSAS